MLPPLPLLLPVMRKLPEWMVKEADRIICLLVNTVPEPVSVNVPGYGAVAVPETVDE
jgi:hypothetical protein